MWSSWTSFHQQGAQLLLAELVSQARVPGSLKNRLLAVLAPLALIGRRRRETAVGDEMPLLAATKTGPLLLLLLRALLAGSLLVVLLLLVVLRLLLLLMIVLWLLLKRC